MESGKRKEQSEGVTYESGTGMCDPDMSNFQNIVEKPLDSTNVDHWLESRKKANDRSATAHSAYLSRDSQTIVIFYEIETGGLGRNADILQIAITQGNKVLEEDLNVFILATKKSMQERQKSTVFPLAIEAGERLWLTKVVIYCLQ